MGPRTRFYETSVVLKGYINVRKWNLRKRQSRRQRCGSAANPKQARRGFGEWPGNAGPWLAGPYIGVLRGATLRLFATPSSSVHGCAGILGLRAVLRGLVLTGVTSFCLAGIVGAVLDASGDMDPHKPPGWWSAWLLLSLMMAGSGHFAGGLVNHRIAITASNMHDLRAVDLLLGCLRQQQRTGYNLPNTRAVVVTALTSLGAAHDLSPCLQQSRFRAALYRSLGHGTPQYIHQMVDILSRYGSREAVPYLNRLVAGSWQLRRDASLRERVIRCANVLEHGP